MDNGTPWIAEPYTPPMFTDREANEEFWRQQIDLHSANIEEYKRRLLTVMAEDSELRLADAVNGLSEHRYLEEVVPHADERSIVSAMQEGTDGG